MSMRIAICGRICSGKSTLARYLEREHGFTILSFASTPKRYASEIFGMEHKDRRLIQDFCEKLREIDRDVWIRHLEKELLLNMDKNIVIDDLRFPNEYDLLRRYNFHIIKLDICSTLQIERIKRTYPTTAQEHIQGLDHVSETYISGFKSDLVIDARDTSDIYMRMDEFIGMI